MADTGRAIDQAARVSEIGFADFTATLVRETFAALLQTNLEQTQVYIDLVERVAAGVAGFIQRTRDDVAPEEITAFLGAISEALKVEAGQTLDAPTAASLNDALRLPASVGIPNENAIAAAGQLDANAAKALLQAVATRIAFGRFQLLETMVKQGVTRLVVDHGTIESRLTFNTYARSSSTESRRRREQIGGAGGVAGAASGGMALGLLGGGKGAIAGGAGLYGMTVSSASSRDRDTSGSSVQIFGRVEIHFKTDYVPLS